MGSDATSDAWTNEEIDGSSGDPPPEDLRRSAEVELYVGAACLIGIAVAIYLTLQKFEADFGCGANELSGCAMSDVVDCSGALTSDYATRLGIPVSLFGACLYAWTFVMTAVRLIWFPTGSRLLAPLSTVSAGVALAGIAYGVYASFALGKLCLLCAIMYCANAVIVVDALYTWPGFGRLFEPLRESGRPRWVFAAVAVSAMLVASTSSLAYKLRADELRQDPLCRGALLCREGPAIVDFEPTDLWERGSEPSLLHSESTRIVARFLDPSCPHCRRLYDITSKLVAEKWDVTLTTYLFPRDTTCNDYAWSTEAVVAQACLAARVIECAPRIALARNDLLSAAFAYQGRAEGGSLDFGHDTWRDEILPGIKNYDSQRFETWWTNCVESESGDAAKIVRRHIEFGHQLGVERVPTMFAYTSDSNNHFKSVDGVVRTMQGVKDPAIIRCLGPVSP